MDGAVVYRVPLARQQADRQVGSRAAAGVAQFQCERSLLETHELAGFERNLDLRPALQILEGTAVSDIPIVENQLGDLALNLDLAEKLDITFTPSMLRNATIIYGEEE